MRLMKYDTNKERTARRKDRANVNQIAAASRQCSREGEGRVEREREIQSGRVRQRE